MAQPITEDDRQLQYIGEMLDELRRLTPGHVGPLLPHLLDMARLEVTEALSRMRQGRSET